MIKFVSRECYAELFIERFTRELSWRQVVAGDLIFQQGFPVSDMYLLKEGTAKIERQSHTAKRLLLDVINAPELLGYSDLEKQSLNPVSARAYTNCTVGFISSQDYLETLKANPDLFIYHLTAESKRNILLAQRLEWMAYASAKDRVILLLLQLCQTKQENERGEIYVDLLEQELAEMAGLTRETITRVLKDLKENFQLVIRRRQICLTAPDELRKKANEMGLSWEY